jgi:hypothetical protein
LKVILDHSTPRPLIRYLANHHCRTAARMGWNLLENGDLLNASEAAGFEVMITCDRNLRYQQNLTARKLAIVEITTNYRPLIEPNSQRIAAEVNRAEPGGYAVVEIALPPKVRRPNPNVPK